MIFLECIGSRACLSAKEIIGRPLHEMQRFLFWASVGNFYSLTLAQNENSDSGIACLPIISFARMPPVGKGTRRASEARAVIPDSQRLFGNGFQFDNIQSF